MPKKHNKMAIWYVISAVLLVVLVIIARQQIGLLLLKTIYISIALALGYYADRTIFAAYRPFEMRQEPIVFAAVMIRRALLVSCGAPYNASRLSSRRSVANGQPPPMTGRPAPASGSATSSAKRAPCGALTRLCR